jgi:hypothetical protein
LIQFNSFDVAAAMILDGLGVAPRNKNGRALQSACAPRGC